MLQSICAIDNCERPIKRNGFCYGHYMKNWRYGTPTPEWPDKWEDVRGKRYGTLTASERRDGKWLCICDCGETRVASIGELNRTGEQNTCGNKGNHLSSDVDYTAVHSRLRSRRGSASKHECVNCGARAQHWSYDHEDPDERISRAPRTLGIAFSLHMDHYQPRCVPCHKRYDLDRINGTPEYRERR